MKRIVLLYGGQSPEHEISVRSARNIKNALDPLKYEVLEIGITKAGVWSRTPITDDMRVASDGEAIVTIRPGHVDPFWVGNESLGKIDFVFPVLHGPNGEDGSIQGLLQLLKVPYAGPDILASATCMDKDVTKRLLQESGIEVAGGISLRKYETIPAYQEVVERLGNPVFVKPANMGSSVGVSKVLNAEEWNKALALAFEYDHKILVEAMVVGRELECAVLGNDHPIASGVGEVVGAGFYSYDEKYDSSSSTEVKIPASVSDQELGALRSTAIAAYKSLGCEGFSRVDMFLKENGEVLVNEINTIPGFTNISMYPKLWKETGLSYAKLLDKIIELGLTRH